MFGRLQNFCSQTIATTQWQRDCTWGNPNVRPTVFGVRRWSVRRSVYLERSSTWSHWTESSSQNDRSWSHPKKLVAINCHVLSVHLFRWLQWAFTISIYNVVLFDVGRESETFAWTMHETRSTESQTTRRARHRVESIRAACGQLQYFHWQILQICV